VVINNWNGGNLLIECVSSLFEKTKYDNFKVIIVDDASTDGSDKIVKKKFKNVKVIKLKKHGGASVTRNIGIEYCLNREKADYVIFLDNDTRIEDEHWISRLVSIMEEMEDLGVLAPIISTPQFYQTYTKKKIEFVRYVPSACVIIKKDVFHKIGGFDTNFLFVGNEDPDFCNRAIAAGFKIGVTSVTRVFHNTSFRKRKSMFWSFICTYNYLRYILLNLREKNLFEIFSLIAIRKNSSGNFSPSNLVIAPDWWKRIFFIPLAFILNLRNFKEILILRRERKSFRFLNEKFKKIE